MLASATPPHRLTLFHQLGNLMGADDIVRGRRRVTPDNFFVIVELCADSGLEDSSSCNLLPSADADADGDGDGNKIKFEESDDSGPRGVAVAVKGKPSPKPCREPFPLAFQSRVVVPDLLLSSFAADPLLTAGHDESLPTGVTLLMMTGLAGGENNISDR